MLSVFQGRLYKVCRVTPNSSHSSPTDVSLFFSWLFGPTAPAACSNKLPRSKLSRLQLDFATRSGVLIRAILLKQCQLIVAMEFLIRPSLTFDVVTYHCFISMFPYSTCKISITPKRPSPEPLFYMRTAAEYLAGGQTPRFGTSPEKPGDTSIPLHYDSCEYTRSSPYNNAASCGE